MLTHSPGGSYVGFHMNNQILHKARILQSDGFALNGAYYDRHQIGSADVIDLNHNHEADTVREPAGFLRKRIMYTEPVLNTGLDQLKNISRRTGDEILTKENVSYQVGVKEYGVDFGRTAFQDLDGNFDVDRDYRTLDNLSQELVGHEPDAEWAISPATHEFYVYKPKETTSAPEPVQSEWKPEVYERNGYSMEIVTNPSQGALSVFMQDDESLTVHSTDGRETRLQGAVPKEHRQGVEDTLRHALTDPSFGMESIHLTKPKGDDSQFSLMFTDHSVYYEYSAKSGFQTGELGS